MFKLLCEDKNPHFANESFTMDYVELDYEVEACICVSYLCQEKANRNSNGNIPFQTTLRKSDLLHFTSHIITNNINKAQ